MADRGLLHVNKVEDFKRWAISLGYNEEPTKGEFEVARLRINGKPPIIIFKKIDATQHVTVQGNGYRVVRRFIQHSKGKY